MPSTLLYNGISAVVEKIIFGRMFMDIFGIIETQFPPVFSRLNPPILSLTAFLYLKEILGAVIVLKSKNWSENPIKAWNSFPNLYVVSPKYELLVPVFLKINLDDKLKEGLKSKLFENEDQ